MTQKKGDIIALKKDEEREMAHLICPNCYGKKQLLLSQSIVTTMPKCGVSFSAFNVDTNYPLLSTEVIYRNST